MSPSVGWTSITDQGALDGVGEYTSLCLAAVLDIQIQDLRVPNSRLQGMSRISNSRADYSNDNSNNYRDQALSQLAHIVPGLHGISRVWFVVTFPRWCNDFRVPRTDSRPPPFPPLDPLTSPDFRSRFINEGIWCRCRL